VYTLHRIILRPATPVDLVYSSICTCRSFLAKTPFNFMYFHPLTAHSVCVRNEIVLSIQRKKTPLQYASLFMPAFTVLTDVISPATTYRKLNQMKLQDKTTHDGQQGAEDSISLKSKSLDDEAWDESTETLEIPRWQSILLTVSLMLSLFCVSLVSALLSMSDQ